MKNSTSDDLIDPNYEIPFRTLAPGIVWPPILGSAGAQVLALQFYFDRSQQWPAERLQARQFEQLGALVHHADANLPHQRKQLRLAGVRPGVPLSMELWQEVPFLLRQDLQANAKAMIAQKLDPTHGKCELHQTSGSTGEPVSVLKTEIARVMWQANALRETLWQRFDLTAPTASITRDHANKSWPPDGSVNASRADPSQGGVIKGETAKLDIRSSMADQLDWLLRKKPAYLISTPSNLTLLALLCQRTGTKLPGLRQIRCYGEVTTDDFRALCADVWGVGVISTYSCEEVGYIALQCPKHPHYHVCSETIMVEVINDMGMACQPGEIGRVVLTPLHNFAMPLFRYVLGDYAEVGEPCDCGRTLPVLKRILGRERNHMVLPNGERRYAFIGARFLGAVPSIAQYQAVQTTRETIEIRVVLHRPMTPEEETTLRNMVLKAIDHPFRLEIIPVDSIPRTQTGKYEDFRCEVE